MKSIKIGSLFLFLAAVVLAVFLGGRQINSRIEETIKTNYQAEISVLKDKLDKQSELINSIINLNNKKEESNDQTQNNTTNNNNNDNNNNNNNSNNNNVTNEVNNSNDSTNIANKNDEVVEYEYIKENGGITITKYIGNKTNVQIPNKIEQLPVLKIGENAFADTKIKSVTLPSSCIEIDWFAFYGCYALSTVYILSTVKTIGYGAFDSCSKSMTIYCEKNSYAQKYAQSFGISYSYFQ